MQTFTTKILNVANPVGVDLEIGKIQAKLSALTYLQTIYGRGSIQRRQLTPDEVKNRLTQTAGIKGRELYFVFYPQGRFAGQDIDLSMDDSLPSAAFFYLRDPSNANTSTEQWDFGDPQVMETDQLSMILYGDMSKLSPGGIDDFTENIKIDVLAILKTLPRITVTNIWKDFANVIKDFSETQKNSVFTRFPYFCFRFDFNLTYPAFPENGN